MELTLDTLRDMLIKICKKLDKIESHFSIVYDDHLIIFFISS